MQETKLLELSTNAKNKSSNSLSAYHSLVRLRNLFFLICALSSFTRVIILSLRNSYSSHILDSISIIVVAIIGISASLGIMTFLTEFRANQESKSTQNNQDNKDKDKVFDRD